MSLSQSLHFMRMFLRHPGEIGAVIPSSDALSQAMVKDLTLGEGESVVEFGPGTGALTKMAASIAPNPEHYLGIEINPSFVTLLRERFEGLRFEEGSAADAVAMCEAAQMGPVRAIVSGLPFACLPAEVQSGVIDAVWDVLPPGGEFRTFQYVHSYGLPAARRFRGVMNERFGAMKRRGPIYMNVPPAFVLCWQR